MFLMKIYLLQKKNQKIDMVNDAFGDDKQEKKRLEKYGIGDLI